MLSMLAAFAFSAVAASTASAKRVWTVCEPVAEGTGKYANSKCTEEGGKKGFEDVVMPVGKTRSLTVVKNSALILKAGTEEIECKRVAVNVGNTIENVLVEGKGPTGRDLVTITFTECINKNKPTQCKVTEPITVTSPTFLNENTKAEQEAEVEGKTVGLKIYDLFKPEGRTELTPKQISEFPGTEAEKQATAKKEEEKLTKYATIKQTGTGCVATTEVTGDGVAARISPEGPSVKKTFIFPCPTPIPDETLWNGLEIGLKLKAFAVAAQECGEVEVELTTKEKWDVQ